MLWAPMLAYVTGTVNQELLLRNEYLAAENRILRDQGSLAAFGKPKGYTGRDRSPAGSKSSGGRGGNAKPDTILGWYRKLVANKFEGKDLPRLIYHEPEPEVRFVRRTAGRTSFLTTRGRHCLPAI
jgi:putative transposase